MGVLFLHKTAALYVCLGAAAWHDCSRSDCQTNDAENLRGKLDLQTCPSPLMIWLYDLTSDPCVEAASKAHSASQQISYRDLGVRGHMLHFPKWELIKPNQGWIFIKTGYWKHRKSINLGCVILIWNTCTTPSYTCDFVIWPCFNNAHKAD